jgi:metal-responsive CopG/Arc/MetJ family transcriptional regulator
MPTVAMLVTPKIDLSMKTAISLPDELFEEADAVAMQIGVSRSQLYATALAEYVAKFRSEQITSQLNAVYSVQAPTDNAVTSAARKTLRRAEW